jgi:ArsR family transcriptional regulator
MQELIDFFKTISDETRLRILALLSVQEICVCNLCAIMDESQPKISRHLAKLRDVGYVRDRRQGQWIFYYLSIPNKVEAGILHAIAENISQYPVLKRDFERLQKMITDKCLCNDKCLCDTDIKA